MVHLEVFFPQILTRVRKDSTGGDTYKLVSQSVLSCSSVPLLIFVSAVDPRHSVGMLASRQRSSDTHWLWHTHLHGHVAILLQVGDGLV
jgi:hypothetical protein